MDEHHAAPKLDAREWMRVGFAMFTVGFGANLFAPMLQVYRTANDTAEGALTAMFGIYALGLIPSLLYFGAVSDRIGRRRVLIPGLIVAIAGSLMLLLGSAGWQWPLYIGRIIIGASVGMGMSAGAAWVKQLSTDAPAAGARRATVAISSGFGLGPLTAGLVAEFAPAPQLIPYLVHIALSLAALVLVRPVRETQVTRVDAAPATGGPASDGSATDGPARELSPSRRARRMGLPESARSWHYFWAIAAWAPWVFGIPLTAFAATPSNIGVDMPWPTAFSGFLAFITMTCGVFIQPAAARITKPVPAVAGLTCGAIGLAISIGVALTGALTLMVAAGLVMGCAYGIMMVGGLNATEKFARPHELGSLIGIFYSLTYVGFFIPFVISLVVSGLQRWAGVSIAHGYAGVLAFGILVCLVSIPPVAKVTSRG